MDFLVKWLNIGEVTMATNSYFNENTLEELIDEIRYVYQSDTRPWVIGYSGGEGLDNSCRACL